MLLLGITYLISALLQMLTGISAKIAFQSSRGNSPDSRERISTSSDFESRAAEIPSRERGAYMPSNEAMAAEYARRFELSLSFLAFLLPVAPALAAGLIQEPGIVVFILLLAGAGGAVLFAAIRNLQTPDLLGLGLVTFISVCLHIFLGALFIILNIVFPAAHESMHGVTITFQFPHS